MKSLLHAILGTGLRPRSVSPENVTVIADTEDFIRQGNALEDDGQFAAARKLYQQAVTLSPQSARAHLNLGNAQSKISGPQAAAICFRQALELDPEMVSAHLNLGAMLLRLSDSINAEAVYREAIRLAPDSAAAWAGLGCVLDDMQSVQAEPALRKTLDLEPFHAGATSRLAHWLRRNGRAKEALDCLAEALVRQPENSLLLNAYADISGTVGDQAQAHSTYLRVLEFSPLDWNAWSNMLCMRNFMQGSDAASVLADHLRYADAIKQAVAVPNLEVPAHARSRLKIGYVSADFRFHSICCFIEAALRHHDRQRFEVHCFYNYHSEDFITQRLQNLADHWHNIVDLDDDAVAQRVRDNGIDILIDLAGHSAHNRLGVFARKPSPLQFTWLGYLGTTGLSTMNYRICDAYTDPPGQAEAWQVETPARMPCSQWCYRPQLELPEPTELPMLKHGFWTFGSFNQELKLNELVLQVWAGLLQAVPNSRLRIVGVTCDLVEDRVRSVFLAGGVAAERVDILGRIEIDEYFAQYREVDIALDTFPYNGATTTCDALIMGVPVATVAGDRTLARGGISLLSNVGLQAWIADSTDALADTVKAQLVDPHQLAQLRAQLPARMRASALMDEERFARDLEALYLRAWK